MKKMISYLLMASFILMGWGCSSKKEEAAPPPGPVAPVPTTPDGTGTGSGSGLNNGDTVTLNPVSMQELVWYVANHPLNDPKDLRLQVQLSNAGGGRFAGTVRISYTDNGQQYAGIFNATDALNQDFCCNSRDDGKMEAEYNKWFTYQGRQVFSGFFQDNYGAVVLVIENTLDTGDADGGGYLTGSIWYKNFAQTFATQKQWRRCWFLYDGPYDCRSSSVITKSSLTPDSGYRKLGTFSGLTKARAFGI